MLALVAGGLSASAGRTQAAFSLTIQAYTNNTFTTLQNNFFNASLVGSGANAQRNTFTTSATSLSNFYLVGQGGSQNRTAYDYRIDLDVTSTLGPDPRFDINILNLNYSRDLAVNLSPLYLRITLTDTGFVNANGSTLVRNYLEYTGGGSSTAVVNTSASPVGAGGTVTTGPLSLTQTVQSFDGSTPVSGLGNPFSFTNVITLTHAGNENVQFGGSFTELSATPAPSSLIAALGCLPVLGAFGAVRRRAAKPAVAV
jgi:hypothetical protein